MEGMIKRLGAGHPETLEAMANLAVSSQEAGKFEDATKLAREVLT